MYMNRCHQNVIPNISITLLRETTSINTLNLYLFLSVLYTAQGNDDKHHYIL